MDAGLGNGLGNGLRTPSSPNRKNNIFGPPSTLRKSATDIAARVIRPRSVKTDERFLNKRKNVTDDEPHVNPEKDFRVGGAIDKQFRTSDRIPSARTTYNHVPNTDIGERALRASSPLHALNLSEMSRKILSSQSKSEDKYKRYKSDRNNNEDKYRNNDEDNHKNKDERDGINEDTFKNDNEIDNSDNENISNIAKTSHKSPFQGLLTRLTQPVTDPPSISGFKKARLTDAGGSKRKAEDLEHDSALDQLTEPDRRALVKFKALFSTEVDALRAQLSGRDAQIAALKNALEESRKELYVLHQNNETYLKSCLEEYQQLYSKKLRGKLDAAELRIERKWSELRDRMQDRINQLEEIVARERHEKEELVTAYDTFVALSADR